MTDLETKLRDGLNAYALETATAVSPPSLVSIAAATRRPGRGRRRTRVVAAALAGGVVLSAGMATALGTLPSPVSAVLREFRSWGFGVSDDDAGRMASVSSEDMTYELWFAPVAEGGSCMYVRVLRSGHDIDHGGASHCTGGEHWPRSAFILLGVPERVETGRDAAGRHPIVAGHLPAGASYAEVEFSNGTVHRAVAEQDGFFVTVLPPGLPDDTRILSVRAVSAGDRLVAVRNIGPPT